MCCGYLPTYRLSGYNKCKVCVKTVNYLALLSGLPRITDYKTYHLLINAEYIMIKQVLITGIATAALLLSATATAHQGGGSVTIWNNAGHGHHHNVKPKRKHKPKFNVNKEQRQQAVMIQQGIKTCQITPAEAAKLKKQQKRIKKAERRMRSDGLQGWERNKLQQRLKNARIRINRFTKNRDRCGRGHKRNKRHGNRHNTHWNFSNGHGSFSISLGH